MRLAIEALEALDGVADKLDFVPCALPPHKNGEGLLPFSLRMALINASIAGHAKMQCEDMEENRPGPSYTYDTLKIYKQYYKPEEIFFLLGSQDYAMLGDWRDGLDFPSLCHLLVAPRGEFSMLDFERQTREFWPDCKAVGLGVCNLPCIDLPGRCSVIYAPLPYLDISASNIREIWLKGQSIQYLAPDPALALLENNKQTALECWREGS